MASKKHNIDLLKLERLSWKSVLEEVLNEKQRVIYINRKKAVDLYIDGFDLLKIQDITKINYSNISRLITKCCSIDPVSGEPFGYAGLIPYNHTVKNVSVNISTDISSKRGLFESLLLKYPSLVTFISDHYFGNKDVTLEKNIKITTLHNKLLTECRRLGIQDYEYPFNVQSQGLRSLSRYVKTLKSRNEQLAIKRENKDARQRFNSTGLGKRFSKIPYAPYSVVQLDGHKIDMLYTVPITNADGSIEYLPATRMWLLAVIDVATRTILGYSLTTEQNYNQTDVLAALKDSIKPRTPIHFTIPGFAYPENGGYPCFAIKETNWALFDSIMLDNAKSHLAHDVVNKLTMKLKCAVNFGSVATPETRGIVERFFGTLEEKGYHRITSTTGSNINDTRRENAEKDAVKYNVTYNDIVELTEYLIALYNTSPHSALNGRTPLQVMESRIKDAGMQPCIANNSMKETVDGLTNLIIERTVRGSFESGKRPYIAYEGVEYRNEAISISTSLVGTKIFIEVNPEDISSVFAYTDDGIELGYLRATGIWGRKSHSLKTRKESLKCGRQNKAANNPFYAELTGYEDELRNRASNSRTARTKQARLSREQITKYVDVGSNATDFIEDSSPSLKKTMVTDTTKSKETKLDEHYIDNLEGLSFEEAYKKGLFR